MLHVLLQVGLCGGFGNDVEVGDIFGVESATEYDFDLAKINGVSVGTLDGFDTPYLCVSLKCVSDVAGKGAMTDQYIDNWARCLVGLSMAIKEIL